MALISQHITEIFSPKVKNGFMYLINKLSFDGFKKISEGIFLMYIKLNVRLQGPYWSLQYLTVLKRINEQIYSQSRKL